jgi:surface antigen
MMTQLHSLIQKLKNNSVIISRVLAGLLIGVFIAGAATSGIARADNFDAQINQLQSQNNTLQSQKQDLLAEASSLEATIAALQAQISSLESQIQQNQAKADSLKRQIAATEAELAVQKKILGENIRAMYLEGDMSTMEMLASSHDLGEYVDKEQYRLTVKDKIKASMDKINSLRDELNKQKTTLDKTIADQRAMQDQLGAQRAEQNRLLALNAGQRSSLDSEIRANSSKIGSLRAQQAAANARLFGSGLRNVSDGTGYPWANVQPFPNAIPDPWGMYVRQCVSYTAWKVANSGRYMPYWGGRGNANMWDDNARAAGIPTDYNPRPGDVAISNAGYYGHAMYVEAVYGDGTIYISQYNGSWDGRYSEARISAAGLVFIHF